MVDFRPQWELLFGFNSRFITFMIFTTFYHPYLTDADEEVSK